MAERVEAAKEILHLIKRVNKQMKKQIFTIIDQYGITVPQFFVLRHLDEGRITMGQLSKSIHLSMSTVSGIVDRLEEHDYVKRVRDEDDRRIVWIEETEKGSKIKEQITLFNERQFSNLLGGLAEPQLKNIRTSLQILHEYFEEELEK